MELFGLEGYWMVKLDDGSLKAFRTRTARRNFLRDMRLQIDPIAEADEMAVDCVVIERIPMKLTGVDRVEAIRQLSLKGVTASEQARLLLCTPGIVSSIQSIQGIDPAPKTKERMWA